MPNSDLGTGTSVSSAPPPAAPAAVEFETILAEPLPIASPQGLRLVAHGLDSKARAQENCSSFVYVYQCPNGHIWPVPITCHQRFCPACHPRIVKRLIQKYNALDIDSSSPSDPFLFVELSARVPSMSRAEVQAFSRAVTKGFGTLRAATFGATTIGAVWNIVPSAPNKLTAYLLLWGDGTQSAERYRKAWSSLSVKVSMRPMHQLRASIRQIFDVPLPSSPQFRADCENAFHGRRNVHSAGDVRFNGSDPMNEAPATPEGVEELFPSNPSTGNNAGADGAHAGHNHCPTCHEPANLCHGRMLVLDFRHPQARSQTMIN